MNAPSPNPSQESIIWSGTPSQKRNVGLFALCTAVGIAIVVSTLIVARAGEHGLLMVVLLLIPAGVACTRWITTRSEVFTLTDQRLKMRRGVFTRVTDDIELYRVKDSHFTQSFPQRMLGIGTIALRTTDDTSPRVLLDGMSDPEPLWERIRALVEARRDAKGVREIDMNAEPGAH